ncbi:6-carboxyhexanoate--CoA ligase [Dendrosporobacter sp. 1207_IL3150]|uniref:6-carboxyhexanoate--CoA ligase n=1 Tax=Dendrosporobacter sp. 1207_IL3150 TaxID=3084054 RepID=UPI002FDAAF9C
MLYSVRMRAAQGAAHEAGGRHISGAERLVPKELVAETTQAMLDRAFEHSRGQADFINITVESVAAESVRLLQLLPITTIDTDDVPSGRAEAKLVLANSGVSEKAIEAGFEKLLALEDSMRGAMLICAETGIRLDLRENRGVRVSRMDIGDDAAFSKWLASQGFGNLHIREAIVLATKVANAPGMVAEICWSDDPEYTAGYAASLGGYMRFPKLKAYGSPLGGRVFFIKPGTNIEALIEYLENQPVLVINGEEAG